MKRLLLWLIGVALGVVVLKGKSAFDLIPALISTFLDRDGMHPDRTDSLEIYTAKEATVVADPPMEVQFDGETTGLYDTAKLDVYDKYAMFLHGNNGLSRIKGDGTGRILVIKDSYANCFAPYLTANYADIDVVDFRNYNYGLDKLIADNAYDQLLVLYSFDSFKSDPYLYRAGVAG